MLGEELRQIYLVQKEKIITEEFDSLKANVEKLCNKSAMEGKNVLRLSTQDISSLAIKKLIYFLEEEGLSVDYKEDMRVMYIRWHDDE